VAKGGYQRQRLQAKKDAERKARKRAHRNKLIMQWTIGVVVVGLIAGVTLAATLGGKKKASANPTTTPSITPTPSPTPYYLIPGCTKPSSAKPNGKQFSKPPAMTIDKSKTYLITLKTTCGTIVWKLDAKLAPATVNNMVFLARQHYFDNTVFARVQVSSGFGIIQGGSQTGTISGGVDYTYPGETPSPSTRYTRGTLAMANSQGPSTNGSQFFIVTTDSPNLTANYTVFGALTGAASFATIDKIVKARGAPIEGGQFGISPNPSIKIISATVTEQ
jgi:peptidyl-prolyl cis-trans isomerase B (cyclophilin B)